MYELILVEDDYQIRNGLSRFFPWQQIGFDLIRSFENGKQALDFVLENHVDVILTDIRMPVMDGLTLTEALKKKNIVPCFVVLSAYRDFEYARRAAQLGIRHYMVKSTKFDELIDVFKDVKRELDSCEMTKQVLPTVQEDEQVDKIIGRITQHIRTNLAMASLQTAAAYVNLNPVYMSRYFREKTGARFIDYLIDVKMKRAAELLHADQCKITQISKMVGYSNEKNFSRAFKKYFSISPNKYRKLV